MNIDFRGSTCWQAIGSDPEMLRFVDIREKSSQSVKVPGGVGIIFVVMALGTTYGCTHPDIGKVTNAVREVDGEVFLGLNTALV